MDEFAQNTPAQRKSPNFQHRFPPIFNQKLALASPLTLHVYEMDHVHDAERWHCSENTICLKCRSLRVFPMDVGNREGVCNGTWHPGAWVLSAPFLFLASERLIPVPSSSKATHAFPLLPTVPELPCHQTIFSSVRKLAQGT